MGRGSGGGAGAGAVGACDTSISRLLVCLRAHLINSRAPRHAMPRGAEAEAAAEAGADPVA